MYSSAACQAHKLEKPKILLHIEHFHHSRKLVTHAAANWQCIQVGRYLPTHKTIITCITIYRHTSNPVYIVKTCRHNSKPTTHTQQPIKGNIWYAIVYLHNTQEYNFRQVKLFQVL